MAQRSRAQGCPDQGAGPPRSAVDGVPSRLSSHPRTGPEAGPAEMRSFRASVAVSFTATGAPRRAVACLPGAWGVTLAPADCRRPTRLRERASPESHGFVTPSSWGSLAEPPGKAAHGRPGHPARLRAAPRSLASAPARFPVAPPPPPVPTCPKAHVALRVRPSWGHTTNPGPADKLTPPPQPAVVPGPVRGPAWGQPGPGHEAASRRAAPEGARSPSGPFGSIA